MRIIVSFLFISLTSQIVFANFADVALYFGQRFNGQSIDQARKKSQAIVKQAETRLVKATMFKSGPMVSFNTRYSLKEHFIDVAVTPGLQCKVGILEVAPKVSNGKSLLFFYGNGIDAYTAYAGLAYFDMTSLNKGYRIFIADYPGYGLSECEPREETVIASALGAYDYVTNLVGESIPVVGHSLGSAVAVQVAAKRSVSALVMVSAFANLSETMDHVEKTEGIKLLKMAAQWKGFSTEGDIEVLREEVKARNAFISTDHITRVQAPIFLLHGTNDEVIPDGHYDELVEAATNSGRCVKAEKVRSISHRQLFAVNSAENANAFWKKINNFLIKKDCVQ